MNDTNTNSAPLKTKYEIITYQGFRAALQKLLAVPFPDVKESYRVSRTVRNVEAALKDFVRMRDALLEKYGEIQKQIPPENQLAFQTAFKEVAKLPPEKQREEIKALTDKFGKEQPGSYAVKEEHRAEYEKEIAKILEIEVEIIWGNKKFALPLDHNQSAPPQQRLTGNDFVILETILEPLT